jgi:hypothetical protein
MQQEKHQQQEVPSWFTGDVYDEGEEVLNQFSGETFYLNAVELSIYDMIMGGQMMVEFMGGAFEKRTATIQNEMAKGLSWFRQHNAEAYMKLLD